MSGRDVLDEIVSNVQRVPHFALKAYEENQGRFERMMNKREVMTILEDYSVLGKQSFNDILQHLIKTNEELVDRHPVFMFPVSDRSMLIYLEGQDEFSGKSREELELRLKVFPVQMHNFVKAQQAIAKKFKDMLENRWAETLAQKVEDVVGKEFKLSPEVKEIYRA